MRSHPRPFCLLFPPPGLDFAQKAIIASFGSWLRCHFPRETVPGHLSLRVPPPLHFLSHVLRCPPPGALLTTGHTVYFYSLIIFPLFLPDCDLHAGSGWFHFCSQSCAWYTGGAQRNIYLMRERILPDKDSHWRRLGSVLEVRTGPTFSLDSMLFTRK